MGKEKGNTRYSEEFRHAAVGRMLGGANVKQLGWELKVPRSVLFEWRKKAKGGKRFEKEDQRQEREIAVLRAQIRELEGVIGRKSLEVDFLESALRRVGAPMPVKSGAGRKTFARRFTGGSIRKAKGKGN